MGSYVWNGLLWFYKIFFTTGEVAIETSGEEFKRIVEQRVREMGMQDLFRLNLQSETFHELCAIARTDRRPILMLMLRDQTDDCILQLVNALGQSEVAVQTINENYLVYGLFANSLEESLARHFVFPHNAQISVWALMVHHDNNIQINARLAGGSEEFKTDSVMNFLNENLNLFHIMCEEDPEYQRLQILQDGKLI